ncbi:hypothetical protein ACIPY6_34595 [Streptomyces sp. NPDC090054]|uniref:hypothetical protein n=1 Tax=Streptomyces sp. NPDC090054 TaxID=3365933 RepID=UPI0038084DAD
MYLQLGSDADAEEAVDRTFDAIMEAWPVVHKLGPGPGGRGGQYMPYSGQVARVKVTVTADSILIYHTHPRGTPSASDPDKALLELFKMADFPAPLGPIRTTMLCSGISG